MLVLVLLRLVMMLVLVLLRLVVMLVLVLLRFVVVLLVVLLILSKRSGQKNIDLLSARY